MGNKRIKVIKESSTGKNIVFEDKRKKRVMSDKQFIKRIESGEYSNYHVRERGGVKYPATNPDSTKENNLG